MLDVSIPTKLAMLLAQDAVSSVVVLDVNVSSMDDMWRADAYSFANTPLHAAQAPLAIARKSQSDLLLDADMFTPAMGKTEVQVWLGWL